MGECRQILKIPQRKSVKKIGIDSNPPVLAGNFPFLAKISGLPFSLDILPVFETLFISLFNQAFYHSSLPFCCGFSAIFTLLASDHEPAISLGAVFPLTLISKCRKWLRIGTYLKIFPGEGCPRTQKLPLRPPIFSSQGWNL